VETRPRSSTTQNHELFTSHNDYYFCLAKSGVGVPKSERKTTTGMHAAAARHGVRGLLAAQLCVAIALAIGTDETHRSGPRPHATMQTTTPLPRPLHLWCRHAPAALNSSAWRMAKVYPIEVESFPRVHALYIRNQKAASQTLWSWLPLFMKHGYIMPNHAHAAAQKFTMNGWGPSVTVGPRPHDWGFIFSFVREPLDMALAGYHEVEHWARSTRQHHSYNAIPCNAERALARYSRFLEHLEQGESVGGYEYHSYPQVLKITVPGVDHFDFLGRVEAFNDDMRSLGSKLNLSEWVDAVFEGRAHYAFANRSDYAPVHLNRSTITSPCKIYRSQLMSDSKLMCRVCLLYNVDYLCLGHIYPAPKECSVCPGWNGY
jgi:hypothetical protein